MTKSTPFVAEQFTPIHYHTARDKAKFANHFADFMLKSCPVNKFPKWFYTQLTFCFGHIAHYNKSGFYMEWFATRERREKFVSRCLVYPCYGQPEHNYCDVAKALIDWLKGSIVLF